jgi:hypothetical protein
VIRSECECCGKTHEYPEDKGNSYYDLCRECAVENELEDEDFDWRVGK